MTLLASQPYMGTAGGGGGSGGLVLRVPADVFTGADLAACRTARDAFFSVAANAAVLTQFQRNQFLSIVLDPANTADNTFETYLPGFIGAYDNSRWVDRTGFLQGRPGIQGGTGGVGATGGTGARGGTGAAGGTGARGATGATGLQGTIFVRQYQNAATIPAVGAGGTYVISTAVFTPSAGWFDIYTLPAPSVGENTWYQEAEIDPVTVVGDTVNLTWSVVLESGGTGPAGPRGGTGATGGVGPVGPTGAGSTINAQDEGVVIPGTIHTINLVGSDVLGTEAAGVLTVTVGGGPPPATNHPLYVGWSPDAVVTETEVLAGAETDTDSLRIPTATGGLYLWVWRSDVDGGDPTEVHITGGGDQRNIFVQAVALTVSSVDGQLIVSVQAQNAGLLGGEVIRIV